MCSSAFDAECIRMCFACQGRIRSIRDEEPLDDSFVLLPSKYLFCLTEPSLTAEHGMFANSYKHHHIHTACLHEVVRFLRDTVDFQRNLIIARERNFSSKIATKFQRMRNDDNYNNNMKNNIAAEKSSLKRSHSPPLSENDSVPVE